MPSTDLSPPSNRAASRPATSLASRLACKETRAALVFAGQGVPVLDELAALWRERPELRPVLEAADERLRRWMAEREFRWSGAFTQGFALTRWLTDESSRPPLAYLQSTAISNPLIFVAQVARFLAARADGLGGAFESGAITALTGHSQGIMPALLVAEAGGDIPLDRMLQVLDYMTWQGLTMTLSYRGPTREGAETCMAAVSGPDREALGAALDRLNAALPPDERVYLTLENTRTRNVLSGAPASLARLKALLEEQGARRSKVAFTWESLAVGGPFHSAYMASGLERMREAVAALGFRMEARSLRIPVNSPVDGSDWRAVPDLTEALLVAQYLQPVRWPVAVAAAARGADWVLDLGPGDGVARLSRSALRGTGTRVLALSSGTATPAPDNRTLFTEGAPEPTRPVVWSDLAPRLRLSPEGQPRLVNRFVAATGMPPVMLPGMTPTTVDPSIVAAAANAGYWSEWAGGGQVTEALFWRRLDALARLLEPGREVVFNALFLDPYLWGLHLGQSALVQRARRAGYPIAGVTVSAGVPELEAARRLLDDLAGLDMRLNSFKPGTRAQIEAVAKIAEAAPEHRLFVQIEGGKAGGHHSWEDLDGLLLDTYGRLRDLPNVVLCVGGGIASEARAVDLLTGAWSARRGLPPMPVDAVFLGTLAMACKEATASPAVKAALVSAGGTLDWVGTGEAKGGVTSGRSQLGADIHYLENAAARAGRLLDQVAGDAAAVAARRDDIIAALDATAKPYFGDVATMTWERLLRRAFELMAAGRGRPEDDGPWLDRSYRERAADLVRRAEARLAVKPTESVLDLELQALDTPEAALERLLARYPALATRRVSPADARYFVSRVCARPGKPVNFVPVIDAEVRRWYKSDSLWQAQDDRYDADQVLIIPGPEAVGGITRADEPVSELLGRFVDALVAVLPAPNGKPAVDPPALPPEITLHRSGSVLDLRVDQAPARPRAWLDALARLWKGPVAALLGEARINAGSRRVPNPARALLVAERGASLRATLNARGEVERLVYTPGAGGEEVRLAWTGDQVRVDLALAGASAALQLRLVVQARPTGGYAFLLDPAEEREALRGYYLGALFGERPEARGSLFAPIALAARIDGEQIDAYAALTGAPAGEVPLNLAFSLVFQPMFLALCHDELAGGLLRLVHLDNEVEVGPGWAPRARETLTARAALTRIEDAEAGRTVGAEARLLRGDVVVATVRARFFLRAGGAERYNQGPMRLRVREGLQATLEIAEEADAAFLAGHDWIALDAPVRPGPVEIGAEISEDWPLQGAPSFGATGTLWQAGSPIGRIQLQTTAACALHPLRALVSALGGGRGTERPAGRRALASAEDQAPASLATFAEVSGDSNPIHRSVSAARLAGLDGPIAHGMWTAARLAGTLRHHGPLSRFHARFVAPLLPGERVALEAERVGLDRGAVVVEASVRARRGAGLVPVLQARAWLRPPRTAAVFPGQGVQRQGMGLEAMGRSPAAAAVWTEADQITRRQLGFSILGVVRENPRRLAVGEARFVHPEGVLHLTAFTQVALAVLAQAQVAELREAGALPPADDPDLIGAGHSLGEYNALGALFGVIDLSAVLRVVWARGLTMHGLVSRDEAGESGYRMGVIRPDRVGLDHAAAERLVAEAAARSGAFLQIVNYNVRGRQYAVTGQRPAIAALLDALRPLERGKPAWVEVPGIDVPFHSTVLRGGTAAFRDVLAQVIGPDVPVERLVGRYVPNLVADVFSLERPFVERVYAATGSPALAAVLSGERAPSSRELGRLLLLDLLAWQFCSPVRWIETQELLLRPARSGGLGVGRVLEVGLGDSPTLANMARATLAGLGPAAPAVEVWNVEADRTRVFALDEEAPPAPAAEPERPLPSPAPVVAAAPAAPRAAAADVPDQPLGVTEALRALLALQARVRPEQLREAETLDELFDGVSSRRNQVLLDLGAELGASGLDGAQDRPLGALSAELERKAGRYRGPGKVLAAAGEEAMKRLFGRLQLGRREIARQLQERWGLGPGWAEATILHLALESREGSSARGGALGRWASPPESAEAARAILDEAAGAVAKARGVAVSRRDAQEATAGADPAALKALEERLLGPESALHRATAALAEGLGARLVRPGIAAVAPEDPAAAKLAAWEAEHGAAYTELIGPRFDARRHVALSSSWADARRDLARLVFQALNGDDRGLPAGLARVSAFADRHPTIAATAAWYARIAEARGDAALAAALRGLGQAGPLPVVPTRPHLEIGRDGALNYQERPDPEGLSGWVERAVALVSVDQASHTYADAIRALAARPLPAAGRVALITGASPGSIALEVARQLLWGGATVVLTSSGLNEGRAAFYRRVYQESAGPGAVLHLLPYNQGSLVDLVKLLDWLGAHHLLPDLLLPFAALKEAGSLGEDPARAAAALRVQLLGVEALIAGVARRRRGEVPCQVILPLSPNHGAFGGDGAYAETKAALEVLLEKVKSERDAWGAGVAVLGARIGWVRGTGLMDANNPLAARLEEQAGITTFSAAEMGLLLAALATPELRAAAAEAPVRADLTGGFARVEDLNGVVRSIREDLTRASASARRLAALRRREEELLGAAVEAPAIVTPLPEAPAPAPERDPIPWPEVQLQLDKVVVVVGAGELGPWGSARTRFEIEVEDRLSPAGVLELAWMIGLVRPDGQGGWSDAESGEAVPEETLAEVYRERVMAASGIRWIEPSVAGYDPSRVPVLATAWLDRDFSFRVGSREEALAFLAADPEHTELALDEAASTWVVTRKAGAEIRVPRALRMDRAVAGLLPKGFDPTRYGLPAELSTQIDRVGAMNLAATADAFQGAGLSPEELMAAVHPARVANTQGSGLGGGQSLRRLYMDPALGQRRQLDALQETLINVVAAHVVQGYVGSYGAMSHPVGACATAAVSLEEALDKILLGKADFAVAGGYDDLGAEGAIGFMDMGATANTDEMTAMGLSPRAMSRPNDRRRHGFVEAHGGGTLLVARGSVALELGLPVLGVLAYAGSFGDGLHRSIPAPGLGALASALGGRDSPLGRALQAWGLEADDVALVYKHDTSTTANDQNENRLHHAIQEALGRTPGNPLFAVSQKSITGHAKGGSAAWQAIGLMQALEAGVIPGNRNLESVDEAMRPYTHLAFTDATLRPGPALPLRAGLLTSLGFGHVSALCLLLHPDAFLAALPAEAREDYRRRAAARREEGRLALAGAMAGEAPLFSRRAHRRLPHADGSEPQVQAEIALLTDPDARLDLKSGLYRGE